MSTEIRLANGSVATRLVFAYGKAGRRTESSTSGADGALQERSFYSYDEKGNNTEVAHFAADGSTVGRWTYAYDDHGRARQWTVYAADGSLSEDSTYIYDSAGRLKVAAEYRADNSLDRKVTYDSRGNELEAERRSTDGQLLWKRQYEYTFDSAGNWVTKTTKELRGRDYAPVETLSRRIEYY